MIEMYYEPIIKALNKSKIKYLVVGGIAVNLYGLNRLTRDLDLMIDISEKNLSKFVHLMNTLGFGTKLSVDEWEGKVAIAFRHQKDQSRQVDIFVKNPIDFSAAYGRRKILKLGKTKVSCISFDDLLEMKEISGRDRDLIDMGYLKKYEQEGKM